MAITTVLFISISKRFISFKRSFRNLVKELGSITASSGAISRKYLNDISYFERSTTSMSDTSKMDFNNKYLNIRIGLIALRPLSRQYLSSNSLQMKEKSINSLIFRKRLSFGTTILY